MKRDNMYRCPYDPELRYNVDFCEGMQVVEARVWCKDCKHFKPKKKRRKGK